MSSLLQHLCFISAMLSNMRSLQTTCLSPTSVWTHSNRSSVFYRSHPFRLWQKMWQDFVLRPHLQIVLPRMSPGLQIVSSHRDENFALWSRNQVKLRIDCVRISLSRKMSKNFGALRTCLQQFVLGKL